MKINFPDNNVFKNQTLIIDRKRFGKNPQLHYSKVFYQNGKKITEEYVDGKLDSYYVADVTDRFKILSGYGKTGKLFYTEVIYLDCNSKPYMQYEAVKTSESDIDICYRKIHSDDSHSDEAYDDFFSCYNNILPN